MKWFRWWFYSMTVADFAMSQFYRWAMQDYGQAGYWMALAIIQFLIGYHVFNSHEPAER